MGFYLSKIINLISYLMSSDDQRCLSESADPENSRYPEPKGPLGLPLLLRVLWRDQLVELGLQVGRRAVWRSSPNSRVLRR